MIKELDIQEACDTIYRFADANQVDPLRGIELMVAYYKQLSKKEQEALVDFMAYTRAG
jgi:hypothetical protein